MPAPKKPKLKLGSSLDDEVERMNAEGPVPESTVQGAVSPPSPSPAPQPVAIGEADPQPAAVTASPTGPMVMGANLNFGSGDPKDDLVALQAKPAATTSQGFEDTQARNDRAHTARQLLDQCRHPITRKLVGVSQ